MKKIYGNDNYIQRDDAAYDKRGEYINICPGCGETYSLFSQWAGNGPEYFTTVILPCHKCDEDVAFCIAVN
jgi:hypothetical protein